MPVGPLFLIGTGIVAVLVILLGVIALRAGRRRAAAAQVELRLTPHAVERMDERDVGENHVRQVLAKPDRIVATTYTMDHEELDSVRLEKDFRGRTLKVWVPPDWQTSTPIAVKSVAWRYVAALRVHPSRVGAIIGRGGEIIKDLERNYQVTVQIDRRRGTVRISGDDEFLVGQARRRIAQLAR